MNKKTKDKKIIERKSSKKWRDDYEEYESEFKRFPDEFSVKNWEKLEISDDFMFSKVMRNQELCRRLLKVSLSISVGKIEYPEEQKSINLTADGRSVRLDVYTRDEEERIYNVEMQVADTGELPKRSRYYQGMIDLNLIEKGEPYRALQQSFVIFICKFDLFGKGWSRYWFENRCREDLEIALEDQAIKVFLNAQGAEHASDEDLKAFLKYLNGETTDNSFVKELEREVQRVRENKEWRVEYMTLLMRDRENMEKGIEIGLEMGTERGENRLGSLICCLMKEGKNKEVENAISDRKYREKLYKQYGL